MSTELFKVLENTTPGFAKTLLAALDETRVEGLCQKTIKAGRSIRTFAFTLKYLKRIARAECSRLERLVGVEGWWRLIITNGGLSDVLYLHEGITDEFRAPFIEATVKVTEDEWVSILAGGQYFEACRFINEAWSWLPEQARGSFSRALASRARTLAATSDWYSLNTGCKQLQEALENPETRVLDAAFREQLDQVDVDSLSGISLHESANALDCLWRERPDLRPDLASRLWSILPPEERWAEKEENITGLQFVFTLARSPLATPSDAQRLIEAGRNRHLNSVYEKLDTLPLFLHLWNLAALWYECGPNPPNPLGDLLPSDTRDLLITGLDKRARKWLSDEERLNLLALAGLLSCLMPERLKGIQKTLHKLNVGPYWFRQVAAEQTFVPAFFAVKGLSLLWPMPATYAPLICMRLLTAAQDYEDRGAAIESLCDEVRHFQYKD